MRRERLEQTLSLMGEVYGKQFSPAAARLLAMDLSAYPEDAVLAALSKCRKELRTFPSVAEIIARIDDGRPGPDEAWAMIPKDEADSVVWTEEMRRAYAASRPLLADDPIAARMAFKEVYARELADARAQHRAVTWEPSLGHDLKLRERAIQEALERGRISQGHALSLLPDARVEQGKLLLPAPESEGSGELVGIRDVMTRVLENAPRHLRLIAMKPHQEARLSEEDLERRRKTLSSQLEKLKATDAKEGGSGK